LPPCACSSQKLTGEIVGTLACHVINADEGHFRGMAVLPGWQGRGVAADCFGRRI
jgi:N-acetylglutamate synthase-like GNAT family acetyltransferase